MNPISKNIVALISGIIIGSIVNMTLIMVSGSVIPPAIGVDATTMDGLKSSMHLFEPRHFIFPFLAHALGTLIGAFITGIIANHNKIKWALGIGAFFLVGGITNLFLLPSPLWFSLLDIACAYIPMAYWGGRVAVNLQKRN